MVIEVFKEKSEDDFLFQKRHAFANATTSAHGKGGENERVVVFGGRVSPAVRVEKERVREVPRVEEGGHEYKATLGVPSDAEVPQLVLMALVLLFPRVDARGRALQSQRLFDDTF
jgi:hypothetical protein